MPLQQVSEQVLSSSSRPSADRFLGWFRNNAILILFVLAYGFYVTGFNVARRDVFLDGTLLYVARLTQLATFLAFAVLFRNHLPSIKTTLAVGCLALTAHLAFSFMTAVGLPAQEFAFACVTHELSGIANAVFVLLLAHSFSTYGPARSSVAIVAAFLLKELLFAWTAVWSENTVVAAQVWMRVLAVGFLVGAMALKRNVAPSAEEHPLQYGVPVVQAGDGRTLRYLVSGADWAFQIIVAIVTPFIFGFMSQLVSKGLLSDGLHDPVSEMGAIVALGVVLVVAVRRRGNVSFLDMLVPAVLFNTLGLMLAPYSWETGSMASNMLLKCANVVNESLLWVLLARKAFEDPRHTYLYLGAFFGIWNVTYARLLGPLIVGGTPVDAALLSTVSIVFLGVLVGICLLLFVLQRANLVPGLTDAPQNPAAADSAQAARREGADASFEKAIEDFCRECQLTPRESEILLEALHGYSMPNIATQLCISPGTVRTHMRNIYLKAGVSNKQELIRRIDAMR